MKNGLVWDCGCCMLLSNILWPKCQYDATAFVGDGLWERGELPCLAFLMIVLWILQFAVALKCESLCMEGCGI